MDLQTALATPGSAVEATLNLYFDDGGWRDVPVRFVVVNKTWLRSDPPVEGWEDAQVCWLEDANLRVVDN